MLRKLLCTKYCFSNSKGAPRNQLQQTQEFLSTVDQSCTNRFPVQYLHNVIVINFLSVITFTRQKISHPEILRYKINIFGRRSPSSWSPKVDVYCSVTIALYGIYISDFEFLMRNMKWSLLNLWQNPFCWSHCDAIFFPLGLADHSFPEEVVEEWRCLP